VVHDVFSITRFPNVRAEFGAGGNRLGCKLHYDDGSVLFILDSQITPEIEQFIFVQRFCEANF